MTRGVGGGGVVSQKQRTSKISVVRRNGPGTMLHILSSLGKLAARAELTSVVCLGIPGHVAATGGRRRVYPPISPNSPTEIEKAIFV